ncbi:hypothetical protein WJX72_004161 [[Myrmecia] bisecta]|uniref:Uncharacterized protein n=1 Tax=[Myrmecia] bisecta TaxID=41462 RepID=A0AAW1PLK0_9CHLO
MITVATWLGVFLPHREHDISRGRAMEPAMPKTFSPGNTEEKVLTHAKSPVAATNISRKAKVDESGVIAQPGLSSEDRLCWHAQPAVLFIH